MLHMVVANHGPDTCATVVPDVAEIASAGFRQITKVSKKLGITIEGAWTHMPGHVIYFLVEAPNAHVINQLCQDIHLMDWNTVVINPVTTLSEVSSSFSISALSTNRAR